MKRYLVLIAAVWLMLALAWAASAETMYVHVREGTFLNGRHEPTRESAVEMRLYHGDAVSVICIAGTWAQIEGGETGTCWCCVDYLADYAPGEDLPGYTVVSNGRVLVRQSPNGTAVGYIRNGDTVEVQFTLDGWAYIGDGYVMIDYLERRKDYE